MRVRETASSGKTAVVLSILNACAVVAGFGRDIALVSVFGLGRITDAFLIATVFPAFVAQISVAGIANQAIVPTYALLLAKDPKEAKVFASNMTVVVVGALAVATSIGVIAAPVTIGWLAPGFDESTAALATNLQRIAFTTVFLMGVAIFVTGLANVHGYFALPALGRVAANGFAWIGVFLIGQPHGITAFTIWLVGATTLQLAFALPLATKFVGVRVTRPLLTKEIRQAFRHAIQIGIGLAASEFGMTAIRALASIEGPGAITALIYAQRIYMALATSAGGPISQVLLPRFAREATVDRAVALRTFSIAVRIVLLVTIPAAVLLGLLAGDIVEVLLSRSGIPHSGLLTIGTALAAYSPGLPLYILGAVLVAASYGQSRYTPILYSWIIFVTVLLLSGIGLRQIGVPGLAFATVVASLVQDAYLVWIARTQLKFSVQNEFGWPIFRIGTAAVLMTMVVIAIPSSLVPGAGLLSSLIRVVIASGLGGLFYLVACRVVAAEDLAFAVNSMLRRSSDRQ